MKRVISVKGKVSGEARKKSVRLLTHHLSMVHAIITSCCSQNNIPFSSYMELLRVPCLFASYISINTSKVFFQRVFVDAKSRLFLSRSLTPDISNSIMSASCRVVVVCAFLAFCFGISHKNYCAINVEA